MSKKKVVVSNNKKKKRNGCCTCLLVAFIVFVAVLGAGVGVGWYFGDKYTKQYLDMSLKDCFAVVRDLTRAKEKNIVEKSYAGTSETEFETQLKKQLFLNESADLNKDTLMEQIVGNKESEQIAEGKNESERNSLLGRALKESGADLSDGLQDGEESSGGGDNAIMNYVSSLFTRENMDLVSLSAYDESEHGNYILNFTDVQLAAFLSSVIKEGLNSEAVTESDAFRSINEILGDKSLSDVLFFDQVVFSGTQDDPHMKMTLSVDVRTVVNGYMSDSTGMNLGFVTKLFLPKRLYVTADVSMGGDGKLDLFINEMNATKMERFYKFVNGLANIGGGEQKDIRETINESAEKIVGGVARAVRDYGDVSEISSGKIKIDLLQALIEVSELNEGKEDPERILTSPDIIYALKYVVTSDFENAIETEYTWKDRYYNADNPSAPAVYKKATEVGDKDILADYEDELLKELERKYLIKRVDEQGNERGFADLMKLFGIGGDGDGKTVLDWIDSDKLGELAARRDDISVVLTDEMLGAIFNAEVNSIISSNGDMAKMSPQVYQVHIERQGDKYFMHAGLAVKADGVLGDAGAIGGMLSGIFGDNMMLKFVMEITTGVNKETYEYAPTTLALNDLEQDEMNRLISILSKLGVDFSVESLAGQIETPMRDALNNMEAQMPGLRFETSKILMADLFSVTVDKVLVGDDGMPVRYDSNGNGEIDDGDERLTGADLKGVINSLYNFNAPETNISGDVSVGDIIKGEKITEEQLGHYIKNQMENSQGCQLDNFTNLIRVDIVKDGENEYAKFTVEIDKEKLFASGGGDFNKFTGGIEKFYAEITVDLKLANAVTDSETGKTYCKTSATVNGMEDTRRKQFDAVIGKFNPDGKAQISFDDRAQEIGAMVYNLLSAYSATGNGIEVENGAISRIPAQA